MKKIITLILSLSLSILLMGCSNITHGKEAYRYNDDEDIKITHTKESTVAKIEIQDSYTKGGQKYFEITTSATGNEIFTYSESEYTEKYTNGYGTTWELSVNPDGTPVIYNDLDFLREKYEWSE